jgi:L-lactate utilization protein LutB
MYNSFKEKHMKDQYGNILKDFNPVNYYRSHGVKTKQAKKKRNWDEYIPKYVDNGTYTEPKKTGAYNEDISREIERILSLLEQHTYIEISVEENVDNYMKNMNNNCRRRGVCLRFSKSTEDGKVFIRKPKE